MRTLSGSTDAFDDEIYIPTSAAGRIEWIRVCEDNGYIVSLTTFWTTSGYRTNSEIHGSVTGSCSEIHFDEDECVRQVDVVSKDHV